MYHGSERHTTADELHNFDVVITTYDTLRSDWTRRGPLYTQKTWARVVLDEGKCWDLLEFVSFLIDISGFVSINYHELTRSSA